MDEDTGLYFYGSRYYDPELARFVQADTVVPSATTSQALNRYSYVINNPLRLTDPTGHGFRDFLQKTLGKHYGDVMIAAGQMLIASGLGGIYGFVVGTIMIAAGTAYNVFIIQRGSFGDFAM
ncbi:MAG: RHS repeat-associated core domain-containing protein, partial [Sedimentisphaerales bacterium]|nr:RHS repeat-associated core domain-containing protein [Sedimentisphaerales bacterium]